MTYTKSVFRKAAGMVCFDWQTWYQVVVAYPQFYSTSVTCDCGGPNQIKDWNLLLNCPFSSWNLNFLVVLPVLFFFFCLYFKKDSKALIDTFVSALAFVLSLWYGLWYRCCQWAVPHKHICVCFHASSVGSACSLPCAAFWWIAVGKCAGPKSGFGEWTLCGDFLL